MKQNEYNWWTDPKNKEQVDLLSWWELTENKKFVEVPLSIVEENGQWVVTGNSDTYRFIPEGLCNVGVGGTKEEAVGNFFMVVNVMYNFIFGEYIKYKRWVPFMKGDWKCEGGRWFTVFGVNVFFRYGVGMKGGFYVPFTKLNVLVR